MLKKITIISILLNLTICVLPQTNVPKNVVVNNVTDSVTRFPVNLENNVDELLTKWAKKMRLTESCNYRDEGLITYPDSVYIQRLYALPTTMELSYNPLVRKYIEMYARRRKQVAFMLGEGKYYFPLFEQELDKQGLPLELKYLPVIESALNPIARSRVGATGLWQFMMGTGRMYDLEINSLVDERSDPRKSTEAAVKYLKVLYGIYKDWNLVIAAYNCGPGNINKAMKRSGGMSDYWAIYPYLPRETRGYVPIFIAATYIMNYYDKHEICPAQCNLPAMMDTVVINKNLHFQQIADMINISLDELRAYNPQFKEDIVPGEYKPYILNMPLTKITAFIDKQDTIYEHRKTELFTHRKEAGLDVVGGVAGLTHKVKRGETLSGIARRYGITLAQLKKWNALKQNTVPVGRKLNVSDPVLAKTKTVNTATQLASNTAKTTVKEEAVTVSDETNNKLYKLIKKTKPANAIMRYKVKKGDTWYGISQKQGVSIAEIKARNNIKGNNLVAGTTLTIEKKQNVVTYDTVYFAEPQLAVLEHDAESITGLLTEYTQDLNKEDRTSFPRINLDNSEEDDDKEDYIGGTNLDANRIIYHKVRIGETIPQIAARYKVSRKDIITWNKLSSKVPKVGQRLMIYLPENTKDGV